LIVFLFCFYLKSISYSYNKKIKSTDSVVSIFIIIYLQGAQGPIGGIGAMGGVGEKVRAAECSYVPLLKLHSCHFLCNVLSQNKLIVYLCALGIYCHFTPMHRLCV